MAGPSCAYGIGRLAGHRWVQRFLRAWTHTRRSRAGRVPAEMERLLGWRQPAGCRHPSSRGHSQRVTHQVGLMCNLSGRSNRGGGAVSAPRRLTPNRQWQWPCRLRVRHGIRTKPRIGDLAAMSIGAAIRGQVRSLAGLPGNCDRARIGADARLHRPGLCGRDALGDCRSREATSERQ